MTIKKGQILEVDIEDVAFGGRGIAKPEGFTVFVDQAVPGDRVAARIYRKKKRFAEARVTELLHASPFRVTPPCRYSGYCGGCKWQFLSYDKQLEYKRRHVAEAIEHIGGISGATVHATLPSDLIFGYRNKMEFSCSDRRWLLPEELDVAGIDRGFALGLHVPGTFHKVLDIDECLLHPVEGNRILRHTREFMAASGRPAYGLKSHTGFWRFLMLRHSVAYGQWMVNVVTRTEDRGVVQPLADSLVAAFPQIAAVVNNVTARKAGVAVGEVEINLQKGSAIREKLGDFEFEISANSFFQTNTRGAERLYAAVAAYARLGGNERVMDLYSGTGTIPIWLAARAGEVTGLEIVPSAVADAEENCRRNHIDNCRFVLGDIRESLRSVSHRPDLMIIDPPRDGMHKDVVRQVMDLGPPRIVYVSCNPATLARDLGMMKTDYRLLEVQPVDMFPHTYHIEAVARLEKV